MSDAIPILDLGPFLAGTPGALAATARQLRRVCEEIGFMYIVNHGVDRALVDATFAQAARFHSQPLEAKMAAQITPASGGRGYVPMGRTRSYVGEAAENKVKPNANETFFLSSRGPDSPDGWPPALPGFQEIVVSYRSAMNELARRLLPLYAVALDLPQGYFDRLCDQPIAGMRLTHYPSIDYQDEEFGIAPHTDSTFLTLLAQNKVPGLQVMSPDGRWIDTHIVPDSFVVNSGNILHQWTNGRFLSTLHRASNTTGQARYAIPYFFHPNADTVIECLPTCRSQGEAPKFSPVSTGDYMNWFFKRNYDRARD